MAAIQKIAAVKKNDPTSNLLFAVLSRGYLSVIQFYHLASNPCQTKWPVYLGGRTSESRNSESIVTPTQIMHVSSSS